MKFSLFQRLALGILSLSILGMALLWVSTRVIFEASFVGYLNNQSRQTMAPIAARLAEYYAENGSWGQLRNFDRLWRELTNPTAEMPLAPRTLRGGNQRMMPQPRSAPSFPAPPGSRYALIDTNERFVAGSRALALNPETLKEPILLDSEPVGYLLTAQQTRITEAIDQNFAESLNRSVLIALGFVLLFSLFLAALLARNLAKPIRTVSSAAHKLSRGDYDTNISTERSDEIGQLMQDVNALAKTLNANRQSQQRWIADISHELRTPLAILKGELHALEDGVRKFDEGTLKSLINETERFSRLVNDLYDLSRAESGDLDYHLELLDLNEALRDSLEHYAANFDLKGIEVRHLFKTEHLDIEADAIRLTQLISNLMENSLRYTDAGGRTLIKSLKTDNHIEFSIEDSAPGVPKNALDKIFDRLYRVETSRSREHGGGGLGLSLCKAIVEAHHGEILADQSELGGLRIIVRFPQIRST